MAAKRSNRWTPILSLMVMASLIVLGNLRAPVSAAMTTDVHVGVAGFAASGVHRVPAELKRPEAVAVESLVGADVDDSSGEYGALVPALYAWSPDVRFVYFRQISKWM